MAGIIKITENRGIEVELVSPFPIIAETLERVGILNNKTKTLYPTCYILKKKEKFYIISFKNLFLLDGKFSSETEEDKLRQSGIAKMMETWGLVKIVGENFIDCEFYPPVYILKSDQREENDGEYKIHHKYSIGNKKFKKTE